MKFCTHMYLNNLYKPVEFEGHRSKVKVTWVFLVFFCVHDAAATRRQCLALSKAYAAVSMTSVSVVCKEQR